MRGTVAKQLRKRVHEEMVYKPKDYFLGRSGGTMLTPVCFRAVYQGAKRTLKKVKTGV